MTSPSLEKNRPAFYVVTVILILMAFAAKIVEKRYHSAVFRTKAWQLRRQNDISEQRESSAEVIHATTVDVQSLRQTARYWSIASLVTLALAILSLSLAIRRHEPSRWFHVPVVVLLTFYFFQMFLIM